MKNLTKFFLVLLCFMAAGMTCLHAQRTVTGTVLDENQQSIPGANVFVMGTQIGTITNISGQFTLDVPAAADILVFSFVGYQMQEVRIGNQTIINVTLEPEILSMDEVVVVGYGAVLKKNLTTSISRVSADDVPKAVSSHMAQLLMGRAAGLQATVGSAQPGGNVNISIRGAGTPIYVVDGVIMPTSSLESGSGGSMTVIPSNVNRGGLAGLNPEDIESIEILKDASASIYGIGASQGVILITTKKGRQGPMRVSYDGSYSMVNNYDYVTPLNAQQYMGLVNVFNKEQYLFTNKLAPYGPDAYTSGWTAPFDESTVANAQTTDFMNMVLKNGSVANHNLILNGGSQTANYYVSGNYFSQDGTVSNSSMERYSLRSNLTVQMASFLKLTTVINTNRNNYNNSTVGGTSQGRGDQATGALSGALIYPPMTPLYDENGRYSIFREVPNPVALGGMNDRTNTNGLYMNFVADFTIIENMLTAKALYGDNTETTQRNTYLPSDLYFDQMYKSRGNLGESSRSNRTMEATVSFNRKFKDIVDFDAVIGMGRYLSRYNGMNVAYDGQHDAIGNDNLGSVSGVVSPNSYIGEDEKRSQFTRLNFDFLDRYVIHATLRRDGTDKFFPDKKYALFPSVSAAWKLSNESFMSGLEWVNLLKFRASYGETGSDNLGTRLYGTYGPYGNRVAFNNNTIVYIPIRSLGLDHPNVSWEKTTMRNIGVDISIFRDRVHGSFDVFRNDVTDRLGNANTEGLSMFGTYPINGSHIRREGWDASINSKNILNNNFSWFSVLNLTRYNSLWMERMPNYDYNQYEVRGKVPTNARYYYKTNGIINADQSNIPASQPETARYPGYPIIVDQNGDGEITIDDIVMINNVPKIYLGFGNTFNYKKFDLDIFMYSQVGVEKYNYAWEWASPTELANQYTNQNTFSYRLWNSQTGTDGTRPGVAYALSPTTLPGAAGTNLGFQDATFLRVRNITLGYNISSPGLRKYFNNLRLYVDAQNPLLFTNFDGFDPEVITGGGYKGGKAEHPMTRSYSFGIRASFN
jgi:TonB-dependent starch-binding outer membrane protein SusC